MLMCMPFTKHLSACATACHSGEIPDFWSNMRVCVQKTQKSLFTQPHCITMLHIHTRDQNVYTCGPDKNGLTAYLAWVDLFVVSVCFLAMIWQKVFGLYTILQLHGICPTDPDWGPPALNVSQVLISITRVFPLMQILFHSFHEKFHRCHTCNFHTDTQEAALFSVRQLIWLA